MLFADVIIDISVKSLDRPFQYRVPEPLAAQAAVGVPVTVPFGRGDREMKGFIIGLSHTPKFSVEKTKEVQKIEEQGVIAESHLLSLAYWIKEHYGATMNDAIKTVMPVRREVRQKMARRIFPGISKEELQDQRDLLARKHHVAKVRLLDGLLMDEDSFQNGIAYEEATKALCVPASVIRSLSSQGFIQVSSERLYRNPLEKMVRNDGRKKLNKQQQAIVDAFAKDYSKGIRKPYLIYGVTGSGKTEVYMNLIEHVLQQGRQAIVLIPEIALTFQTVGRFYGRFGDRVSVIHSRLSAGERYDQYQRAKEGKIQIMIGPRSALFAPFTKLGLIVIDEEHETSYQSDAMPKYHAREVAVQRAKMLGASVVMGSATPSLEAYYRCQKGQYQLFQLNQRAGGASLPDVLIADLREEMKAKNYSIFSRALQEKIEDRLKKKEQVMLFINRRGYAGFVSCRSCGKAIQCDNCSVSMKPHEYRGKVSLLKCHYCGAQKPMPPVCPYCGSKYIGTFGLGTQQAEEMTKKRFPQARVLRMDADTTSGKKGHDRILQAFARKEADILVGTQMIVKGHDFPDVTLVGVLAADLSLNAGDYRAAERTYALLAQAAGRAGRAQKQGEVVFQTYQPDHYSVVCAASGNYGEFYRREIAVREMLQYPPVSNILEVLVFSDKKKKAALLSEELYQTIGAGEEVAVLGPGDAAIAKLKGFYRRVLYIKSGDYGKLCRIKDRMEEFMRAKEEFRDCMITFTFNY